MSFTTPFDKAWGPEVPFGHTAFTWGHENEEPVPTTILPKEGARNILITSALPYVNNVPHLGNIIGCVLSGDVYSRFCESRGYNKLYICGTDEYGTATETKAQQEGVTPQQICDKYHVIHKEVYDFFDIKFDYFGRTTTAQQTEIAQDIFYKCDNNKYVVPQSVEQLHCGPCDRFLADRYAAGTCPLCGFHDAKGDQCDKCSQLLNAIDLINPKCTTCGAKPQVKSSAHLFLDLPNLQSKLTEFVKEKGQKWSDNSLDVTNTWLNNGLLPRCITRDLKWGTPVPKEGYTDKVFYVWFDAPIGYISITANYTKDWEQWWKNPENVELVQFMGKDNVPFHSVIFPSTLLAADDNYTLVDTISTTEYINYEGTKFSKSRGIGVFGTDVISSGIPIEIWRYYLIHNRPEGSDSMFTWDDFAAKANTELPNNIGNLSQRSLAFIKTRLGGVIPPLVSGETKSIDAEGVEVTHPASPITEAEITLEKEVNDIIATYIAKMDQQQIKDGLKLAMEVSGLGNKYMQTNQPWNLFKTDINRCNTTLHVLTQLIYLVAILAEPFMPSYTQKVLGQLNATFPRTPLAGDNVTWNLTTSYDNPSSFFLPPGHAIGTPSPIFSKISPVTIETLRQKFSGVKAIGNADGVEFPVNLVVGEIVEVTTHPNNPKCYVVQVNIGEEKNRQVVCNWVDTYTPEQLLNQKVTAIANIKPSRFGGVQSEGLLLTAMNVTEKGSNPVFLTVDAPVGTKVIPKNGKYAPVKVFDIKAKLSKLMLAVGPDGKCLCGGSELVADEAIVTVSNVSEGSKIC